MKTNLIAATAVALLLTALNFGRVQAQTQQPPQRGTAPVANHGIAVIDITYILDNYSRLKAATEAFKRE